MNNVKVVGITRVFLASCMEVRIEKLPNTVQIKDIELAISQILEGRQVVLSGEKIEFHSHVHSNKPSYEHIENELAACRKELKAQRQENTDIKELIKKRRSAIVALNDVDRTLLRLTK